MDVRQQVIADATRTIIEALGYDLSDPHLRDTPERTARFLLSWHTRGVEPPSLTCFENGPEKADPEQPRIRGLVTTGKITVHSVCAHHGLPFIGEAVIGYIPNDKVLGLSKFARVLDHFAHRFQVQERLAEQVASYLDEKLRPVGVGVLIQAEHCCMAMRGANKPGHRTGYSALRGALFDKPEARAEWMALALAP